MRDGDRIDRDREKISFNPDATPYPDKGFDLDFDIRLFASGVWSPNLPGRFRALLSLETHSLMTVLVVDAGIGNIGSIVSMLRRIGHRGRLIDAPCDVKPGDRLLLPGVGAFDAGMAALVAGRFDGWLREVVADGIPLLGICLGMQLLFDHSEEGSLGGLGLIRGQVVRLPTEQAGLRLPHMGWNIARPVRDNPILPMGEAEQRFYFVHSYCARCEDPADQLAVTDYGGIFTSAVGHGSVFGVQFHPEKSHRFGMAMLERFAVAQLGPCLETE